MQNGIIQSKPLDPSNTDPHRLLDAADRDFIIKYFYDLIRDPDIVKFRTRSDFTITLSLDDNGHPISAQYMENRRP